MSSVQVCWCSKPAAAWAAAPAMTRERSLPSASATGPVEFVLLRGLIQLLLTCVAAAQVCRVAQATPTNRSSGGATLASARCRHCGSCRSSLPRTANPARRLPLVGPGKGRVRHACVQNPLRPGLAQAHEPNPSPRSPGLAEEAAQPPLYDAGRRRCLGGINTPVDCVALKGPTLAPSKLVAKQQKTIAPICLLGENF